MASAEWKTQTEENEGNTTTTVEVMLGLNRTCVRKKAVEHDVNASRLSDYQDLDLFSRTTETITLESSTSKAPTLFRIDRVYSDEFVGTPDITVCAIDENGQLVNVVWNSHLVKVGESKGNPIYDRVQILPVEHSLSQDVLAQIGYPKMNELVNGVNIRPLEIDRQLCTHFNSHDFSLPHGVFAKNLAQQLRRLLV